MSIPTPAASVPPLDGPHYGISFPDAIKRGFTKYVVFAGRASLSEYWWWQLFNLGGIALLAVLSGAVDGQGQNGIVSWIATLFILGTIIPNLAVTIRRLHDTARSGWYYLLTLIPFVGSLILFIFVAGGTSPQAARYGPPMPPMPPMLPFPAQPGGAGAGAGAGAGVVVAAGPASPARPQGLPAASPSKKLPNRGVLVGVAIALVLVTTLAVYGFHRMSQLPPYVNPNGPDPDPGACFYDNDPVKPVNHVNPPSCFPSATHDDPTATCTGIGNDPYSNNPDPCADDPDPDTESPNREPTQVPTPPPDAVVCSVDPEGQPFHSAARGNDHTTCPFAEKVEVAYADAGGAGQLLTVRAHSPVTKKSYTMSCSLYENGVVECTGGVGALVYLY